MSAKEKEELTVGLAHFLSDAVAAKSIQLELLRRGGRPECMPQWEREWAELRRVLGITGWMTYEETLKRLDAIL